MTRPVRLWRVVGLLGLSACRVAPAEVPDSIAKVSETQPVPPTSPLPAPEPSPPDAGRWTVESSLEEDPLRLEVVLVRGERRHHLLNAAADVDAMSADMVDVDQFVVEGSEGRIVFVQLFFESGEDVFRREILAFAIDADLGEVIWDGDGRYDNSFGYCETVDIPEPRVEEGVLIIDRWTGTFVNDPNEPLGDPCTPEPEQRTEEARLEF